MTIAMSWHGPKKKAGPTLTKTTNRQNPDGTQKKVDLTASGPITLVIANNQIRKYIKYQYFRTQA